MDSRTEEILTAFPGLRYDSGFQITSPSNPDYNCIAWAFAKDDCWMWPEEDADGVNVHAARQLNSGLWTSKLGESNDIQHSTPYTIQGRLYGKVACILRRHNSE